MVSCQEQGFHISQRRLSAGQAGQRSCQERYHPGLQSFHSSSHCLLPRSVVVHGAASFITHGIFAMLPTLGQNPQHQETPHQHVRLWGPYEETNFHLLSYSSASVMISWSVVGAMHGAGFRSVSACLKGFHLYLYRFNPVDSGAIDDLPKYKSTPNLLPKQMVHKYRDGSGKWRVCGGSDLRASQAYPLASLGCLKQKFRRPLCVCVVERAPV